MEGEKTKVSCRHCGTTNYFPANAGGKRVVCGRCKTDLPLPGEVLEPAPEEALALFQYSSLPVLADFYSMTCQPCVVMEPVVERLARRRAGNIVVVKVNVERYPELARQFAVQAVPTFLIILKGLERDRISGGIAEEDFAFWVASRA